MSLIGGTNDNDDMSVHIFPNLSAWYDVDEKVMFSSPGLTCSNIQEIARDAYVSHKKNVGNGKGQTKGDDPHALYAGGVQPAATGRETTQKGNCEMAETAVAAAAASAATPAPEWW